MKPMVAVREPTHLIDRRALVRDLARLGEAGGEAIPRRRAVAARVKAALVEGREVLRRRFETGAAGGAETARGHRHLADQIVRTLFEFATLEAFPHPNPTTAERIAVVAVGGYGRGELAPHSDIDLLFLIPYKPTPWIEQVVEYLLYGLWDAGLQPGQATRSIDECLARAGADQTIHTALLEARYVAGDVGLYGRLRRRFAAEVVGASDCAFVEAMLAARECRHRRMGDSRYVLEPNVKDGKGALRDLHSLWWIARHHYRVDAMADLVDRGVLRPDEFAVFAKAHEFLWTVRGHLHLLSGRAEERLTFDIQPEIARRMRYQGREGVKRVERFMRHYFLVAKDVGDLTRVVCAAIASELAGTAETGGASARRVGGFRAAGGRLMVTDEAQFARDPVAMIRLFHVAERRGLDIHPATLRLIGTNLKRIDARLRASPEANRLFLDILTSKRDPETALRRMNEAGVLGRFIPDFGRVVARMQHDMYHVYTVDEHSIRAVGVLAAIERGELRETFPLASTLISRVLSRRVLYLGVFLHDIAKGRRGDHSEVGAEIARALARRLGFTPEETDTVGWLVRYHLSFSATAFRRDPTDPQTVADFVAAVQSLERLRLLLVLTAADIRAVGPAVWNAWKGALLRQLYHLAEEVISAGHTAEAKRDRVAAARAALAERLTRWPAADIARHLQRLYPPYWLSFDSDTHARHARLLRDANARSVVLDTRVDRRHEVTEVTLVTADRPGLFATMAGAMALAGASIVDARILTTADGVALDVFWVQDAGGGAFARPDRLARLASVVERALAGALDPGAVLSGRRSLPGRAARAFAVEPRVLVDNRASTGHTVIEVTGRDRPGLLHDVTRALAEARVSIVTAHVSTYGERAVDVFYVKDAFGHKITHGKRLARLKAGLMAALAEPGETVPALAAEVR